MSATTKSLRFRISHAVIAVIGLAGCCVAQAEAEDQLVVSPYYMRTLYRGIDNALEVAVPGVHCKELKVSTSQGTLTGSGCNYQIRPDAGGKSSLKLEATWTLKGEKRSSFVVFSVKDIPLPKACFAGTCSYSDTISIRYATAAQGLIARLEDLGFDYNIDIVHYRLQVLRDFAEVFSGVSEEAQLSLDMHVFLAQSESGDALRFSEINVKFPDRSVREIAPLRILIR